MTTYNFDTEFSPGRFPIAKYTSGIEQLVPSNCMCSVCNESGAVLFVANFALLTNMAHTECMDKTIKCEGCGQEHPARDMVISYWHAFTWRCEKCESEMK